MYDDLYPLPRHTWQVMVVTTCTYLRMLWDYLLLFLGLRDGQWNNLRLQQSNVPWRYWVNHLKRERERETKIKIYEQSNLSRTTDLSVACPQLVPLHEDNGSRGALSHNELLQPLHCHAMAKDTTHCRETRVIPGERKIGREREREREGERGREKERERGRERNFNREYTHLYMYVASPLSTLGS